MEILNLEKNVRFRLTDVEIPVLPFEMISVESERYAFRLNDAERFEVVSHRPRLSVSFGSFQQVGEVVEFLHRRSDPISTGESESVFSHDGRRRRSVSRNEMRILEIDSVSGEVCGLESSSASSQYYSDDGGVPMWRISAVLESRTTLKSRGWA